jgi:uncharacterized protein YkwD
MKKIFSLLAVFTLIFTNAGGAFAATFSDVPTNYKYRDAIDYIAEKNIVQGYADGTYKPNQLINRAEFTKIIIGAKFPAQAVGSGCFSDVADEWFALFVCFAKDRNIVKGNPDGTFRPASNINTAEAYKIVLETFIENPIYDETGTQWYDKYLEYAGAYGLNFSGTLDASHNVTRGEMAQMIGLVLQNEEIGAYEKAVLDATNAERAKQGLPALIYNKVLEKAGYLHAKDMSDRDFFEHTNPDGRTAEDRVAQYYDRNFKSYLVAENLWEWADSTAKNMPATELAGAAMNGAFGWMQSPTHRANILNPDLKELGVGFYKNSDGKVFYVQEFGAIELFQ